MHSRAARVGEAHACRTRGLRKWRGPRRGPDGRTRTARAVRALPSRPADAPAAETGTSSKFLYFAGETVPPANGPGALILDRVLARRMRSLAAAVGRDTGHDPDGSVAGDRFRRS
ncbi:hypothetical protein ABZ589_11620 [Streptomyces sp. NPDC013313]|uniref:8-oxoguanine DNA glycosylase OGG fold protein n=1 Tax=Streptomyces sp. NPDC013313 TaxID=3155603 RepID=UPI0033D0F668